MRTRKYQNFVIKQFRYCDAVDYQFISINSSIQRHHIYYIRWSTKIPDQHIISMLCIIICNILSFDGHHIKQPCEQIPFLSDCWPLIIPVVSSKSTYSYYIFICLYRNVCTFAFRDIVLMSGGNRVRTLPMKAIPLYKQWWSIC